MSSNTRQSDALSAADRALAAWESATVQSLNPRLSAERADDLWSAITAFREHRNAGALRTALQGIATAVPETRTAIDIALDNFARVCPASPPDTATAE